MKNRFFVIALVSGAIVSLIPEWVAAQTPTPSSKNRTQRPAASPSISNKPTTTAPAPNKPPTSVTAPNTSMSKLPVVSASNAAKSSNLPKAATKPKPLSPAEKQQVLSGQTAANPIVLDTLHIAVDSSSVNADLVFRKSSVWMSNGFMSSSSNDGALFVNLHSKTNGQMYLVDVTVDSQDKGISGFKLNGQPFPAGIVGGSNHLLFFVRGDSSGNVSSEISADHEWQFYSCEVSAVK